MAKISGIRAVGFDLDDTLVMTEEKAFEFENKVLALMGRPSIDRSVHRATWGRHLGDAIVDRSPGINADEFMNLFRHEWTKHLEDNPIDELSQEVADMLVNLSNRGFYLFILTGRDGFETAHLQTGKHPISLHIAPEDVYHKDNVRHPKPDPRAFDWLWAKGFAPSEVVFVGDSIYDGQAADGAGVNFVATLESGLKKKEDFAGIKVTAFLGSLPELSELLG